MTGGMEMFGRVFVLRLVATADVAANHAKPQVYPSVPDLQTILTPLRTWRDSADLIEMPTADFHS